MHNTGRESFICCFILIYRTYYDEVEVHCLIVKTAHNEYSTVWNMWHLLAFVHVCLETLALPETIHYSIECSLILIRLNTDQNFVVTVENDNSKDLDNFYCYSKTILTITLHWRCFHIHTRDLTWELWLTIAEITCWHTPKRESATRLITANQDYAAPGMTPDSHRSETPGDAAY